jgi:hypothetical protein
MHINIENRYHKVYCVCVLVVGYQAKAYVRGEELIDPVITNSIVSICGAAQILACHYVFNTTFMNLQIQAFEWQCNR